jgi:hypothetical protein
MNAKPMARSPRRPGSNETRPASCVAGLVVELLEPRALLSGTWTTVDQFQLAPGVDTAGGGIAADAAGNVYVFAEASGADGVRHAIIREKRSGGDHWETVLDYASSSDTVFSGFAVSSSGAVYVCGNQAQAGGPRGFVLERRAGQADFAVVDRFEDALNSMYSEVAVDAAGNVFVCGTATIEDSPGSSWGHWLVRERPAGGDAFQTVDLFQDYYPGASAVAAVDGGPAAGVYVVGNGVQNDLPQGGRDWLVRRSTDGGQTWSDVDTFKPSTGFGFVVDVAGDVAGNVYVAGQSSDSTRQHWIVRRSPSGNPGTWSVDDDYRPAGIANVGNVGVDPATGTVYATGTYQENGFTPRVAIVRAKPPGGAWQTVDTFQLAPGKATWAGEVGADPAGNVYVAGAAGDADGHYHAYVRAPVAPEMAAVSEVYVRGNAWAPAFKAYLAAQGLGDGDLGYRVDDKSGNQAILPWVNVDQVVLRYDRPPAGAGVPAAGSVLLRGDRAGGDYAVTAVAALDARTFALTLDRPLGSLSIGGEDGVRVRVTVPGAGPGGGDYAQEVDALQGDADRSGGVLATDFSAVKKKFFRTAAAPGPAGDLQYTVFHDLDGSGGILANDFSEVKKRFFDTFRPLPAAAAPFSAKRIGEQVLG